MPLLLEPRDVIDGFKGVGSVLIVSCPICPPMSFAMRERTPFIEFFKHGIRTAAFEDHIRSLRETLKRRGIETEVYTSRVPSPLMCLWTEGQRERFQKRASGYDAVLVMGCNSATDTVEDALDGSDCVVIQAMRTKAIANATTTFRFPMIIELDMHPAKKRDSGTRHGDTGRDHPRIKERELS